MTFPGEGTQAGHPRKGGDEVGEGEGAASGAVAAEGAPTDLVAVDPEFPDLQQEQVRLELLSPLEQGLEFGIFLGCLPVLAGLASMLLIGGGDAVLWGLPLIVGAGLLRSGLDCRYEIDSPRRLLSYRRSFFGFEREEVMAHLDEVQIVTVRGQSEAEGEGRRWSYAVVFLLTDGTSIQVSSLDPDLAKLNRRARALAGHVGAAFLPGRREQVLEQVPDCKLPEVIRSDSRRGAAGENLLGEGIFTAGFGYLLCLPAIWWTAPEALGALAGLFLGSETLTAASGVLVLLMLSLFPAAPVLVTGLRMMLRALGESRTRSECQELESAGFERGFDLVANLLMLNVVVWMASFFLEVALGVSLASLGTLAAVGLGGLNLATLVAGLRGYSLLADGDSPSVLPEAVRLRLGSVLEGAESRCGYCGTPVAREEAVACNLCETLHHRDCWQENARCTTFGCGCEQASDL